MPLVVLLAFATLAKLGPITALSAEELQSDNEHYKDLTRILGPERAAEARKFEMGILGPEREAAKSLETAMLAVPEVTLMSIDPDSRYDFRMSSENELRMPAWEVGAWTITGMAVLKDEAKIAELAAALKRAVLFNRFETASCFEPRHAIRFSRGTDVVTLLVCFQCLQVDTDGFKERSSSPYFHIAATSEAPRIWDQIFEQAGLKIGYDRSKRFSASPAWSAEYPPSFFASATAEAKVHSSQAAIEKGSIRVKMTGSFARPGTYFLHPGSTLIDAVIAAGGAIRTKASESGYKFWIEQEAKPPAGQEYGIDAMEGADKLRHYLLRSGDSITEL